jgi:hypothetical protein
MAASIGTGFLSVGAGGRTSTGGACVMTGSCLSSGMAASDEKEFSGAGNATVGSLCSVWGWESIAAVDSFCCLVEALKDPFRVDTIVNEDAGMLVG